MEIRIKKTPGQPTILAKISLILGGVLISTSVLALAIKFFEQYGIWLGLLFNLLLIYLGFNYTKSRTRSRIVTWGILGMTIFSIVVAGLFYFTLSKALG
jgi:hypothetical protein